MLLYITQCLSGDGYGYSYHRGEAELPSSLPIVSHLFSSRTANKPRGYHQVQTIDLHSLSLSPTQVIENVFNL